jgi:hypothetical protein
MLGNSGTVQLSPSRHTATVTRTEAKRKIGVNRRLNRTQAGASTENGSTVKQNNAADVRDENTSKAPLKNTTKPTRIEKVPGKGHYGKGI